MTNAGGISIPLIPLGMASVLLLSLSCSREGENASAPPAEPEVWTVSREPILTIGEAEGEEPYLFSRITSAVLLPDGGVAVADGQAEGIRIFSPEGVFHREIGHRGEGPGEFGAAAHLQLSLVPPDTLEVYDARLYRLTRYHLSGDLASTTSLQAEDGRPEMYLGTFSTGEMAFAWLKMGPRDWSRLTPDTMQLARFSPAGRMTASLGTETGIIRSSSGVYAFSPHLHARLVGDSLFLTNGARPEIQVRDYDGERVRTISVPIAGMEFATAWNALEEEVMARGNETERGWLENQPSEGEVPRISELMVDDRGRLWVKRYDPRTDNSILLGEPLRGGEWLVVRPEGSVVATVRVPEVLTLLGIRGDLLLGTTRDELGVERIRIHSLDRAG